MALKFNELIHSRPGLLVIRQTRLEPTLKTLAGLAIMGMITFVAPNTSAIMGSASRDYYGIISAFMNLLRNGGHIVGIALPTLILIIVMGSLGYNADMSDPDIINNIGLREAYAVGMRKSFQVSAIIMVVVSILSTGLSPARSRRSLTAPSLTDSDSADSAKSLSQRRPAGTLSASSF